MTSKRKRKPKKGGRVVKISQEVYNHIVKGKRRQNSIDGALRRLFGIATRKGRSQGLKQYWVLKKPNVRVFDKLSIAKGEAIRHSVRAGQERVEEPVKVREVR